MHHHQFHLLNYDVQDKKDLMWHTFLKMIGAGLVNVFVVAILYYEIGLSLYEIFIFSGIHSCIVLLLTIGISGKFILRYGTKLPMIIGVVGFGIYLYLLSLTSVHPNVVFLAPIFSGIHTAFFRIAFHFNMYQYRSERDLGSTQSTIAILKTFGAALSPIIGGYIADQYGESYLFLVSIICISISLIPLMHTYKQHIPIHMKLSDVRNNFTKTFSTYKGVFLSFAGLGYIKFVGSVLRGIMLFAYFGSYTKLGIISSVSTVIVIISLYFLGKVSDKDPKSAKKAFTISNYLSGANRIGASILLVTLTLSQISVGLIDAIHKLSYQLNSTYLNKIFYASHISPTPKEQMLSIIFHELGIHTTKIILCVVFALVFYVIGNNVTYLALPFIGVLFVLPLLFELKE